MYIHNCVFVKIWLATINGEVFAGLNFHGIHTIMDFYGNNFVVQVRILNAKYSWENFRGPLKNHGKFSSVKLSPSTVGICGECFNHKAFTCMRT